MGRALLTYCDSLSAAQFSHVTRFLPSRASVLTCNAITVEKVCKYNGRNANTPDCSFSLSTISSTPRSHHDNVKETSREIEREELIILLDLKIFVGVVITLVLLIHLFFWFKLLAVCMCTFSI